MKPFGDEAQPVFKNATERMEWERERQARAVAANRARLIAEDALRPKGPVKAGMAFPGTPPTKADLDAIHAHRIADRETDAIRGQMAFASALAAAPGLVAELRKVSDELGR